MHTEQHLQGETLARLVGSYQATRRYVLARNRT